MTILAHCSLSYVGEATKCLSYVGEATKCLSYVGEATKCLSYIGEATKCLSYVGEATKCLNKEQKGWSVYIPRAPFSLQPFCSLFRHF